MQTSNPQSLKVGALCLLLGGFVLLGVAGFLTFRVSSFIGRSRPATGIVTALSSVESRDSNSNPQLTYAPVFSFETAGGRTYTITSRSSSNPPAFEVGEAVNVLYDPADPDGARIDSFWQLWGVPVLLGSMGTFFFAIAAAFTFTLRHLMRRSVATIPTR